LTVPVIGVPVVIAKGGGAGAGADPDDTLFASPQPFNPKVAAEKSRTAHNTFPAGFRLPISMLPLF